MSLHSTLNTDQKPAVAPVVSLARGVEAPDTTPLTTALQTTLELEQLLQIFSDAVQEHVPHSGLTYRNDENRFVIGLGQKGRHQCSYRMTLLGSELGEVSLNRNKRFSEQDLAQVEFLLCSLVYPLRNALLYREAVAAAHRDPLTGTGNRAALEQNLRREVALAQRTESPLSLLAIDIDHFKKVNDHYGHSAGDCVLRGVARRIGEVLRDTDLVYRYGGEEFVILLHNTPLDGAALVAERIRAAVAATPCHCEGYAITVTVSIGAACLAQESGSALFDRADQALYQAKAAGRDQVVVPGL